MQAAQQYKISCFHAGYMQLNLLRLASARWQLSLSSLYEHISTVRRLSGLCHSWLTIFVYSIASPFLSQSNLSQCHRVSNTDLDELWDWCPFVYAHCFLADQFLANEDFSQPVPNGEESDADPMITGITIPPETIHYSCNMSCITYNKIWNLQKYIVLFYSLWFLHPALI
jgi:hypothetical protein